MISRKAEQYLKRWFNKPRRKPLVLRGARQVGKSTLVRQFSKNEGLKLFEVNLERNLRLDGVFRTLEVDTILREIEGVVGQGIRAEGCLLFLDEIQATPHAIAALRYFYEEMPELAVVAAGSLLEFTLSDHSFSMPVGRVEYYHMGPLTFLEYLGAVEPKLVPWVEGFDFSEPIPESAHAKLLQKQREYLFVGGLPEAVAQFVETKSLTDVADVHRSISESYQDDFSKYARQEALVRLQRIFGYIPRNVGRKVKYVNFSPEERSKDVKSGIELLSKAQVCHRVWSSHCSGVPLSAEVDENKYKLIFMDVGLANHICRNRWSDIAEASAQKLVNEGPLAEQFIGQHLAFLEDGSPHLTYWMREGKVSNAEVDYVISLGPRILPIEVKSGASGSLKSIHQFVLNKKCKQAIRFDLNPPTKQAIEVKVKGSVGVKSVEFELISLPLYMVEWLPSALEHFNGI
jgi:predicted AAA+ superfamily ATPase